MSFTKVNHPGPLQDSPGQRDAKTSSSTSSSKIYRLHAEHWHPRQTRTTAPIRVNALSTLSPPHSSSRLHGFALNPRPRRRGGRARPEIRQASSSKLPRSRGHAVRATGRCAWRWRREPARCRTRLSSRPGMLAWAVARRGAARGARRGASATARELM